MSLFDDLGFGSATAPSGEEFFRRIKANFQDRLNKANRQLDNIKPNEYTADSIARYNKTRTDCEALLKSMEDHSNAELYKTFMEYFQHSIQAIPTSPPGTAVELFLVQHTWESTRESLQHVSFECRNFFFYEALDWILLTLNKHILITRMDPPSSCLTCHRLKNTWGGIDRSHLSNCPLTLGRIRFTVKHS